MAANTASCLIIGGGLAGLMAAVTLQQQGFHPIVLDKGYGIGGRLASRRIETPCGKVGLFDYGAQHFIVSTAAFQPWVDSWIRQGIVRQWSPGFTDAAGELRGSDRPHYCGTASNRAIAQHLAQTLEIHNQQKVTQLTWQSTHWVADTESGKVFQGDAALLTPPVPQTLALLEQSGISLADTVANRLQAVTYAPCLAVLALLAEKDAIPEPGGLYLDGEPLQWLGSNHQKGICSEYGVTLLAGPEFSQQSWEADKTAIAACLIQAAQPWLNGTTIAHHVHRWKYSQPLQRYGEACEVINHPGPLVLAGDAFGPETAASPVEGAALSGLAAAEAIKATRHKLGFAGDRPTDKEPVPT